jgi:hypothetical protein
LPGPDTSSAAFEVRDKPVGLSDIPIFGRKCLESGVREAAVVGVAVGQQLIPADEVQRWAERHRIGLVFFRGWRPLVEQVLFWSAKPQPDAAAEAVVRIYDRLVAVEVSEAGARLWAAQAQI